MTEQTFNEHISRVVSVIRSLSERQRLWSVKDTLGFAPCFRRRVQSAPCIGRTAGTARPNRESAFVLSLS